MSDLAQGEIAYSEQEIIRECQDRFTFSQEGEGKNRSEFEFDKRFVEGDQWDPTIRDERFSDRRPCLTVNITDATCRRVINACRENRPRLVCHPVSDGADIDTAKVIDGLFRHIEYSSDAHFWYDTAVENSVQGGWGWLAIESEYISDTSDEQELRIKGYVNPLMCYADPNSRMPDGSDMDWFMETEFMKRTEYKARFGKIDPTGWRWVGRGDDVPDWSNKEEIRVAKYWRVERVKDQLLLLSDNTRILRSDLPRKQRLGNLHVTIVRELREVLRKQIRCYLLTSNKILTTTEWPGKWIPRVPVYGRRTDLNGKMMLKGMVRDLRDPARIYNYAQTSKTEVYAMQPKSQWVGAEGFMNGHENAWRDANRKPIVALEYKPIQLEDGSWAPPPERMPPPQPNQGFAEWGESSKSDFLAVAGMPHDPGQDAKGEVISGIAIKRREGLADVSNFDFYDNFCRSLNHLGRIIVNLLPYYYDTQRMIRIIREDGTPSMVTINQMVPNETPQGQPQLQAMGMQPQQRPQPNPMQQAANHVKHDLTVGDYEVVVDTGPSYQTKREQSAEAMLELLATPAGEMVAKSACDLMVRAMDFPNSDMVADRLASMIPAAQMDAQLQDLPERARGIVAGLQQQLKQLQQQNLALSMEVETKRGIEQMKQAGETHRVQLKEEGANERERMKTGTAMHDTHVKAVTAHDVAEIGAASQLLNTHVEQTHERAMAKEMLKEAGAAEKRSE